jgi:hypothetical protein
LTPNPRPRGVRFYLTVTKALAAAIGLDLGADQNPVAQTRKRAGGKGLAECESFHRFALFGMILLRIP